MWFVCKHGLRTFYTDYFMTHQVNHSVLVYSLWKDWRSLLK